MPPSYPLKKLNKMQKRVAIWILGTFQISPSLGIEAIVGFIPIYLTFKNLVVKHNLELTHSHNHII